MSRIDNVMKEQRKEYCRFVITGMSLGSLLEMVQHVLFDRWMFEGFSWDKREGKKYHITFTILERGTYNYLLLDEDSGKKKLKRLRVYKRMTIIQTLRLLWLLVWSKPVEKTPKV